MGKTKEQEKKQIGDKRSMTWRIGHNHNEDE
jgi:hypothetical protein